MHSWFMSVRGGGSRLLMDFARDSAAPLAMAVRKHETTVLQPSRITATF